MGKESISGLTAATTRVTFLMAFGQVEASGSTTKEQFTRENSKKILKTAMESRHTNPEKTSRVFLERATGTRVS